MKHTFLALALVACGGSQEPPAGVSTAPQSVPRVEPEAALVASVAPAAASSAPEPEPPHALGRLHAITGMATRGKKLDAQAVVARIEKQPDVLDTCSLAASAEPNAPDGSWNVKLSIQHGKGSLDVQSATEPDFDVCLHKAAATWSLTGLPDGELMLLLGLAQ